MAHQLRYHKKTSESWSLNLYPQCYYNSNRIVSKRAIIYQSRYKLASVQAHWIKLIKHSLSVPPSQKHSPLMHYGVLSKNLFGRSVGPRNGKKHPDSNADHKNVSARDNFKRVRVPTASSAMHLPPKYLSTQKLKDYETNLSLQPVQPTPLQKGRTVLNIHLTDKIIYVRDISILLNRKIKRH